MTEIELLELIAINALKIDSEDLNGLIDTGKYDLSLL